MRSLVVASLLVAFASFMVSAKDSAKKAKKKHHAIEEVSTEETNKEVKRDGAPCESKEDILKKLEEEKKAKENGEKPKAFSLQGGNTGCSVK